MPITDSSLPPRLLNALEASGESFVVLHGEAKIGTGSLESDLDLAVKHPPDDVIRLAAKRLKAVDLHRLSGGVTTLAVRWHFSSVLDSANTESKSTCFTILRGLADTESGATRS